MKREIKFRAWHNKQNRFIDLNGCDIAFKNCLNVGSIYSVTEQGVLRTYPIEDIDLIQYTGLKDKNGKEIYEGDVVRFKISPSANEPLITHLYFPVIFIDGMFCLEIPEGDYPLDAYIHQEAEVIGNIYENPELLNQ